MSDIKLYQGDCLDILKDIPVNSIDTLVTSPPYYNAREYSQGEVQSNRQKGNPPFPYYQYPVNCYEHILIFSKHVRDLTKIPCPVCHQLMIRSDSSAVCDIQKWECSNPDCPDKSPKGRGKRFSARTMKKSQN